MKKKSDNTILSHTRPGASPDQVDEHRKDHICWTRRSFLSTLGFAALSSGMMLNGIPVNTFARSKFFNRLQAANNDRVLILIQLGGGNDGLNTIIPVSNDIYHQKRPTIRIPKQEAILLSDDTGMHPAMSSLEPFWGEGNMAVVHNVGYSNTNRSHARATNIWTTGSGSADNLNSGWAGRYLIEDNPDFIENPPEFPLGVRIGGSPVLFQSELGNLGVTFGGASQFNKFLEQGGFYNESDTPANEFGRSLSFARKIANSSFRYLESIQSAADSSANLVEYPNTSLARSLSVVARLIRGGLNTKIYLVSKGGFDSHNNQGGAEGSHANNLADIANSVQAFYSDLTADSQQNRALTMTFSEFGRTLNENSSSGTDHGSSAPVMIFGPVNGGEYGEQSDLVNLDRSGDPVFSTDYRSIYSTILERWFELPESENILNSSFENLEFIPQSVATSTETNGTIARSFRLNQNYPNPFNPTTVISFNLPETSPVELNIYDITGRKVRTLLKQVLPAGEQNITFDASSLPSGIYIYRITTPSATLSRKMTLIK